MIKENEDSIGKENNSLNDKITSKKKNIIEENPQINIEKNMPIEEFEFIFENKNQNPKKIPYISHYYKSKIKKAKKVQKKIQNETNYLNNKKMYSVSQKYLNKKNAEKDDKENKKQKISPYNLKNVYKNENRNILHKSQSSNKNNNMESNFMKLCKDSNIYTSNVNYIKNQKMLLFDKFHYDNNVYKPDRAKLFDMTRIPNFPNKKSFIYKTTNFRAGHFISNSNNDSGSPSSNSILNSLSLLDKNKNNQYEKCLQFRNFSNTAVPSSYVDNTFQSQKRHHPSDTFYKELMEKKNETFEYYFRKGLDKEKKNREIDKENGSKDEHSFNKGSKDKTKKNKKSNIKNLYYRQIAKNNSDLNGYSTLLSKKKNNWGQPLSFPKIFSSNIVFDNKSQKERYERISESFYNLKELMDDFKKEGKLNELDYIYEYVLSKNIDKKYLTINHLNNFYNFLQEKKLPLDLTKSVKENIILALEFDKNKNKSKKIKQIKSDKNIFMKKLNIKNVSKFIYKNKYNEDIKELKPLIIDLERQNKINNQKDFAISDRITIRNELKKELEQIKNDVINKQKIIQSIQNTNYENRGYYKEKEKESKTMENFKKIKEKVFESNERLYYTWYKNKNSSNINNFVKRAKLTELYFYNRNNQKIRQKDIEQEFYKLIDKNKNKEKNYQE